jgi:hypothetical protein
MYSRWYVVPKPDDWIVPLHVRYPVMTVIILLRFPLKDIPDHRPRPVLSCTTSLCTVVAHLSWTIVNVPPAWKLSLDATGSVVSDGPPKTTFVIEWYFRALLRKSFRLWNNCQGVLVSAKPAISVCSSCRQFR